MTVKVYELRDSSTHAYVLVGPGGSRELVLRSIQYGEPVESVASYLRYVAERLEDVSKGIESSAPAAPQSSPEGVELEQAEAIRIATETLAAPVERWTGPLYSRRALAKGVLSLAKERDEARAEASKVFRAALDEWDSYCSIVTFIAWLRERVGPTPSPSPAPAKQVTAEDANRWIDAVGASVRKHLEGVLCAAIEDGEVIPRAKP